MFTTDQCNSPQGIDVEVHQVVIDSSAGMVTNNGKVHISVNEREKPAHVCFEGLEGMVDKGLRDVFAIQRWVFEIETVVLSHIQAGMLPSEGTLIGFVLLSVKVVLEIGGGGIRQDRKGG